MNPLFRMTLIAAAVALLAVVAFHFTQSSRQSGWEALAAAQDPTPSVESLEKARDLGSASEAGPWIDFQLAIALFDRGQPGDIERAGQIAREAAASHPGHAVTARLQRLVEAIESYSPAARDGA
jgi:hypothetical protein